MKQSVSVFIFMLITGVNVYAHWAHLMLKRYMVVELLVTGYEINPDSVRIFTSTESANSLFIQTYFQFSHTKCKQFFFHICC